jgi:hypothetical protein
MMNKLLAWCNEPLRDHLLRIDLKDVLERVGMR